MAVRRCVNAMGRYYRLPVGSLTKIGKVIHIHSMSALCCFV
jgi:hypothetical protein